MKPWTLIALLSLTACTVVVDDDGDTAGHDDDDTNGGGGSVGCEATIPGDATVVTNDYSGVTSGETLWVCPGGTVTLNGSNATVYAEGGTDLTINGSGSVVHVKAGDVATINAANVTVYYEEGADVTVTGTGVTQTRCDAIVYSGGPTNGC